MESVIAHNSTDPSQIAHLAEQALHEEGENDITVSYLGIDEGTCFFEACRQNIGDQDDMENLALRVTTVISKVTGGTFTDPFSVCVFL